MDISSPGYRYWTTYDTEGDKARITAHYMREQTQAAIKARQQFSLRVFGLGGGMTVGVRAVTRSVIASSARSASGAAMPVPVASLRLTRQVLTSPASQSSKRRLDGGLFDPWDDPLPEWVNEDPFPPLPPQQPPGGGGGGFMHAAVRIELFAPGGAEAVAVWDLPEAIAGNVRTVTFDPPGLPGPDAPVRRVGWWTVTVTATGPDPVMIHVEAHATMTRVPFRTRPISTRLFDHLFRVALEALVPSAGVNGATLTVRIGDELAREFGIPAVLVNETISPVSSSAKLKSLNITAVSGRTLKDIAGRKNRTSFFLNRVQNNDIAIRIQAAFDRASFSAYGFDVAELDGDFGELFLAFNRNLTELSPVSFLDVDFSQLAATLIALVSLFTEVNTDVNQIIETVVAGNERVIRTYLREVVSRAVGQTAVLHEVSFANNAWQVRYFDDPPLPNPNLQWRPWVDDFAGGLGGVGGLFENFVFADAGTSAGGTTPASGGTPAGDLPSANPLSGGGTPLPGAASNDPLGVFPDGFRVEEGVAIERLDRHQSLVVIMMENRSFDHLLGGLAAARPRETGGYDGPPSNATNAGVSGFFDKVPLVNARDIALGTVIPTEPRHSTRPTDFQIGDGTEEGRGTGDMNGFARDVANRSDSPQLVMTMYGEQHLPVYYKLADEFAVCNRWFCAHAGPTWPNRFATIMGSIPTLDNFAVDDPNLGYLKYRTIFDVMTSHEIEWKVFESDLSLIRLFDRFRLDDRRVIPIDDKLDGFDATLRTPGPLPRVMFVEPNFADLPPLATANDDHPPGDLAAGQAFIARVCDAIWSSGRFAECLVVITYDEHGGFYDHVAPPGTPKSTLAPPDSIPPLHPDGPKHMGPRVPTFVLSPYVSAGKADYTIYDHTSILKTILVHNRSKLRRSVFTSFGERVNQAAHVGQSLDLQTPRQAPQPFDPMRRRPLGAPAGSAFGGLVVGSIFTSASDVVSQPSGPPPIPPRTVTIVPRTTPPQEEGDEPEFHAALRRALKPRR